MEIPLKDQKKAKWILGSSGIVLSALMLTQFSNAEEDTNQKLVTEQQEKMSEREKELVNLDWTNFEIVTNTPQQKTIQSDRKTRRS